jgi:excisionase family DNA binding protein
MSETKLAEHPEGKLLTVAQAADWLAIRRSKMYQLITAGAVRHLRVGKCVRIRESALVQYEEKNTVGG